jgi:hypothetical protein
LPFIQRTINGVQQTTLTFPEQIPPPGCPTPQITNLRRTAIEEEAPNARRLPVRFSSIHSFKKTRNARGFDFRSRSDRLRVGSDSVVSNTPAAAGADV